MHQLTVATCGIQTSELILQYKTAEVSISDAMHCGP